jgi:hypothetical protein
MTDKAMGYVLNALAGVGIVSAFIAIVLLSTGHP